MASGGNIFNWFKGYLTNIKQYVNWQDTNSEIETVSCGLPQGFILGPLLFILYVNDLPKVSKKCVSILLTDDTTILFEGNNIHFIGSLLNFELDKLVIWFNVNTLFINVSKTHYMVFHRVRKKIEDIILNNNILQQVHYTQLLGIIIDHRLKWANHISYIKNKIAKCIDILLKALKYKCYCSYTIISFFHTLFTLYGVLLQIFTSNHSLYSRNCFFIIIRFSRYNSPTKLLFQQYNILPFHRLGLQLYNNNNLYSHKQLHVHGTYKALSTKLQLH